MACPSKPIMLKPRNSDMFYGNEGMSVGNQIVSAPQNPGHVLWSSAPCLGTGIFPARSPFIVRSKSWLISLREVYSWHVLGWRPYKLVTLKVGDLKSW